jgi:hypothetical protein
MNLKTCLIFHATVSTATLLPTSEIFNNELVESCFFIEPKPTIKQYVDSGHVEDAINLAIYQLERTNDGPSDDDVTSILTAEKTRIDQLRYSCGSLPTQLSADRRNTVGRVCDEVQLETKRLAVRRIANEVLRLLDRILAVGRFSTYIEAAEYHLASADFRRYMIEQDPSLRNLGEIAKDHYNSAIELDAGCLQTIRGYNGLGLLLKDLHGPEEAARYMESAIKKANALIARTYMEGQCSIEGALYYKERVEVMERNLKLWSPDDDWVVV